MKLVRLIAVIAIALTSFNSFGQDPNVSVYIQNGTYLNANVYQFDVMMMATGATSSFQLRTFQAGLYVNPAWVNGGTLTITNAPTYSEMAGPGYNGAFQWNATNSLINCSVNFDVVTVNGCISTTVTSTPIIISRIQVKNSINFTCTSPDIKFNYVANANPYRLRTDFSWRAVGCTTNYDMFYPGRTFTGSATYNGELYTANDADGKSPVSTFNGNGFCSSQLTITAYLEGFYMGSGQLSPSLFSSFIPHANTEQADTITVELRTIANPHGAPAATFKTILYSDGKAYCIIPAGSPLIGNSYWIALTHRSAIETWSANPVLITSNTSYDFTTAQNQAFGGNMTQTFDNPSKWAIYSGDISDGGLGLVGFQDDVIESQDYVDMENAVSVIAIGYVPQDITGDGVVESGDYFFMENNVSQVIFSFQP